MSSPRPSATGAFAPTETDRFNLRDFARDFKGQLETHCSKVHVTVDKPLRLKTIKPTAKFNYSHYSFNFGKLSSNDASDQLVTDFFKDQLVAFFTKHNVTATKTDSAVMVNKAKLEQATITARDAGEFFFELNKCAKEQQCEHDVPLPGGMA